MAIPSSSHCREPAVRGAAARWRPLLPLALALALAGCATVGITGRSQFVGMSQGLENQMGMEAWQQTLAESKVVSGGAQAQMVQRIGTRVADAARRHPEFADTAASFEWEFVLIDAPDTVNAFALPGGKCAVYTGLLTVTQDEASLAAVMGHEVAHALARHGGERMTQQLIVNAGLTLAQLASGDMSPQNRELLLGSLGVVGQTGVLLPFSRTHESEADHIGLFLAADAGYDPQAAVGLWQRMAALGGERPPELLSTHPSESTRIARLQAIMPEAQAIWRDAKAQGR